MPWECQACQVTLTDDQATCPKCGDNKSSWTVTPEATRQLVIATTKLDTLRGTSDETTAALEALDLLRTDFAWCLPKSRVKEIAARGHLPATSHLLVVQAKPRKSSVEYVLTLRINYERQAESTLTFRQPLTRRLPNGSFEDRFLCVYGNGSLTGVDFAGISIIDLSEATEEGYAPELEVLAAGKTRELEVRAVPPPRPNPTHTVPNPLFAFDSAFPRPGIFDRGLGHMKEASREHDLRFAVFGHTDKAGSDAYNKKLADRRAKAVYALLVDDLALFEAVAQEEGWGTAVYQAMLRSLGNNPAAIDGEGGPNTSAAVGAFQRDYNEGAFHVGGRERGYGTLAEDDDLGPRTEEAIRDAYHAQNTLRIDPARFIGPRHAGCGEFNPLGGEASENRRVTLAIFAEDPPPAEEFPCREGKVSACPLDAPAGSGRRCPFYRDWIDEPEAEPEAIEPFHDFQWLKDAGENGRIHLSALTTVPDGTAATFTVYRCPDGPPSPPPQSSDGVSPPDLGAPLATIPGEVRHGVAYCKWTPEGFDPFKLADWYLDEHAFDYSPPDPNAFLPQGHPETIETMRTTAKFRPPVFRIDAGHAWGYSGPPGQRLDRIQVTENTEAEGLAIKTDGSLIRFKDDGQGLIGLVDEVISVFLHTRLKRDDA